MDSNRKDESLNRRREEALARRLGEALDRVAPGAGLDPCPDPELIAAYHEQALGPEESAQCESHFAACSRCRKILAVLAASNDTPLAETEVARLGELVAAARAPRPPALPTAVPTRSKLMDWRVRWLAPALGVAAVLAVWFAIKPPWRNAGQGSSGTLVAQAPKNETLSLQESSPQAQLSSETPAERSRTNSAAPGISKHRRVDKIESGAQSTESLADNNLANAGGLDGVSPKAKVAEQAPSDEKKEQAASDNMIAGALPSGPAPAVAPPPRTLAEARPDVARQTAPSAPVPPSSTTQSVTVTGAAPQIETAGGAGAATDSSNLDKQAATEKLRVSNLPINGRSFQALAVIKAAGESFIVAPQLGRTAIGGPGSMMWRAGKGGSIEHSDDTGRTWRPQASPLHEDWLSGAAVSKTLCWLVGRHGSIARTTDGKRWEKIASPPSSADPSGKLPDWNSVAATGAQAATITASDGRRFATQNGGKTWQLIQAN